MNQAERIGRFEVQERLRSNAFAIIYRGRDPFDGRRVQIKFCVATDEGIRRRFLEAAEQASSLRHANIATVYEFGSGDSKPYLVQEAFSEATLGDLLARREPTEDVLKLYYLMQIARGLEYAHGRGVLHRELRPATVMVDRSGEVKLADFGTARLASAFAQLGNGAHRWPAVGWLLPELLLGLELDVRSDVYGFGALAYELLAGRPPHLAESLAGLIPQILETDPHPVAIHWPECPPALDRLILRCLSRDPGRRFASMEEVIREFDQVVPVPAAPEIIEQETTMVIAEVPSVPAGETNVLETAELLGGAEEPMAEDVGAETSPGIDLPAGRLSWQQRGSEAGVRLRRLAENLARQLAARARQSWSASRRRPWSSKTLMATSALLLVSTVLGWTLLREGEDPGSPLPIAAPELPGAPAAEMTGSLVVDARPWGKIERVLTGDGDEIGMPETRYTPLRFELAPGLYRVEVTRPGVSGSESCEVTVVSAATARCDLQLAVVETRDFFRQTEWWQ